MSETNTGPSGGFQTECKLLRGAAEVDRVLAGWPPVKFRCDQNDLSGRDRLLPPRRDCRGKPVVAVDHGDREHEQPLDQVDLRRSHLPLYWGAIARAFFGVVCVMFRLERTWR